MKKKKVILAVDDSKFFLSFLKEEIEKRFGCFSVTCFNNPLTALKSIEEPFDMLLLDWEMDKMDGRKFLEYAKTAGIPFQKVIITSAHPAERLHAEFKKKEVLSVINKSDPKQMGALFMILNDLHERE